MSIFLMISAAGEGHKRMEKQMPKVVVGCAIVNDKREILMVRSYKWPKHWIIMGGHIEWGEKIADAVAREVMEEVGLSVKFVKIIDVAEFVLDPDFHSQKHMIALQSECKVVGDTTPKIDNDEIQEARWFTLADAVALPNILPATKTTLKKMLAEN